MSDRLKGFTWVHLLISTFFGAGILTYFLALMEEAKTGAETYIMYAIFGALLAFMSTFAAIFVEKSSRNK